MRTSLPTLMPPEVEVEAAPELKDSVGPEAFGEAKAVPGTSMARLSAARKAARKTTVRRCIEVSLPRPQRRARHCVGLVRSNPKPLDQAAPQLLEISTWRGIGLSFGRPQR